MAAASSLPFIPSFRAIRNAIATLPLAILAHDNLLSLYRVKGSSMEPTLRDGDVLVVRKSDGIWQRWTRKWPNRHNNKNKNSNNNNSHFEEEGDNHDHDCEWAIERGHVLEYEKDHSRSSPRTGWLRTPPVPVTGNIVVFQDPTIYPAKWSIKRVIGLGGQMVLVNNSRLKDEFTKDVPKRRKTWRMEEFMTGMKVVTTSVPPYSIWVEGDNAANSQDSQFHGPVSKKLLIGIAEYRVWPPWRVGKLDNSANSLLMEEEKGQDENVDHQNIPLQPKYRSRSYWPWKRA